MNPVEAYRIFKSITLHVQGRFDYSPGYMVRPPKRMPGVSEHIYQHFCNRFRGDKFKSYVISSIIVDRTLSDISTLYNEELFFNRNFDEYIKRIVRTPYYFQKDIDMLFSQLIENNYKFSDWLYGGGILQWYMQGKVHINTFTIFNEISNFLERGEKKNYLFEKLYLTFCSRYVKLCEISEKDMESCKRLLLEKIVSLKKNSCQTGENYG